MSVRQQRGRAVKRRSAAPRAFYIVLAVIAVIGIAALGTIVLRARQSGTAAVPANKTPLNAPTGKTPEGFYYKGNPEAPVTVVEYSDFQCPFCGRFATTQGPAFDQNYVNTGKVKYVFHDYPLRQHPNAIPAALAARCAGDQNAFWPMHDLLFAKQAEWVDLPQPLAQFTSYANQLKLDSAAFNQCVSSGKYATAIQQAQEQGNQVQIPGTPTFMIGDQKYDATKIQAAVDAALAAKK